MEGTFKKGTIPNQIIWKRSSTYVKQETLETATTLRAFVRANYDSYSSLNKEIEIKEHEPQRIKQEKSQEIARLQNEMKELKDGYEDQVKQFQEKKNILKRKIE